MEDCELPKFSRIFVHIDDLKMTPDELADAGEEPDEDPDEYHALQRPVRPRDSAAGEYDHQEDAVHRAQEVLEHGRRQPDRAQGDPLRSRHPRPRPFPRPPGRWSSAASALPLPASVIVIAFRLRPPESIVFAKMADGTFREHTDFRCFDGFAIDADPIQLFWTYPAPSPPPPPRRPPLFGVERPLLSTLSSTPSPSSLLRRLLSATFLGTPSASPCG